MKQKIGVILSGCGVYDGAEIHESVLTLLAIDLAGAQAICFAPDIAQHHVINHTNGEEMNESRNVLVEAARIARGDIQPLSHLDMNSLDALAIPGGFGAAKNLTKWAFEGPDGAIDPLVQKSILQAVELKKPILAMCMGPTVVAKALTNSGIHVQLTVGTTAASSPYDIAAVSEGMTACGATAVMKTIEEIQVDEENKIVSIPCYMMEATVGQVYKNIQAGVEALVSLLV